MAFGQNIEEITLRIRAEGRSEAEALRQEMGRLEDAIQGMFGAIAEGENVTKNVQGIAKFSNQIGLLKAALAEVDPEYRKQIQLEKELTETQKAEQREREHNLKETAAKIRAAVKAQEDETKRAGQESLAQEREVAAERERLRKEALAAERAAAREKAAAERAESRERAAAERAEATERQHNLREAAKERVAAEKAAAKEKEDAIRLAGERILAAEALANQKRESLAADEEARARLRTQRQEAIAREAYEAMTRHGYGEDDPFWSSAKIEGTYKQAKAYGEAKDRLELLNRAHDQGHESAKKFSYGLLNVAHAFQDAQYGMGAVLNNIPLVVQAFGGGPGLAGTIMIAGVVIDQTMPKIKQFAREMGMIRDPALENARSLDAMKVKINALVEKPWKVDLDYRSIEKGKAELTILEGRLQAFQAAVAKQTPMQEKVGKGVLDAISQFAGEEGEAGGGANIGRIVAQLAGQRLDGKASLMEIETARQPEAQRARELRAGVATTEGLIRRGVFQPDELDVMRRQQASEAGEATTLEATARENARQRILADTVGAALKGNREALDKLIALLGRPEAQALMRGNVGLGIKPVDPKFMGTLRESTPAAIGAMEDFEEDAALIDQKLADSIEAMKRARLDRKQATDQEISSLVSKKARPLEGELGTDILKRIQAGDSREDIAVEMNDEVLRRMGDVPNAGAAAKRIARQVTEATFADVMAAKGPGIDDRTAAGNLLREQAEATPKGPKVLKDPVTGKPLTDAEQWRLKQMDEEIRNQQKDREHANTPAGMQQAFRNRNLMQMQGIGQEVAQARPDLNQQQVMQVAQTANKLIGQNVNRTAAIYHALFQLQREMMQTMQRMQVEQAAMMGGIGQARGQNRRMQQARPTLLPTFPR